MSVVTLEGIVKHGPIKLGANVRLPEQTKVYVVVPDIQVDRGARIITPHLAHPEQIADFKMEIVEEHPHASL